MRVTRVRAGEAKEAPRVSRWIRQGMWLLLLLLLLPVTSPWWSQVLRREIADLEGDEGAPPPVSSLRATPTPTPSEPMITASIRVRDEATGSLVAREIQVPVAPDVSQQIARVVSALVSEPGAEKLLPPATKVLDVVFAPMTGTVYVDLSTEFENGRGQGALDELRLVQGLILTIHDNFQSARAVQILVDGHPPGAGHLDLSRPIRRDDRVLDLQDEIVAEPNSALPQPTATPPAPERAPEKAK